MNVANSTHAKMAALLTEHMKATGISQAELAEMTGRTPKHINQVFNGKAGSRELDFWAFCLGLKFAVSLEPM